MKKIIFIVICLALSGCVQKVGAPKLEAVQAEEEEEKSVSAIVITATAPETSPPKSDED